MVLLAGLSARTILIETALISVFATRANAAQIVGALKRGGALTALANIAAGDFALVLQAALTGGTILIETALIGILAARANAVKTLTTLKRGGAFAALANIAARDFALVFPATLTGRTIRIQAAEFCSLAACTDAAKPFGTFKGRRACPALSCRRRGGSG